MAYIIVDIETTGLRTYNSRIVEVAAVVLGPAFAEIERWSSLVNPGPEALALAQPKAMEVNRLTREEIEAAPSTENAAEAFQGLLDRHKGATIHAFNNEFDSWFLAKEPWNAPSKIWGECVMKAAMELMDADGALQLRYNGTPKYPNLREAIAFFGLKTEPSHRAIGDARAAADVFIEILSRYRSCPNDAESQQEARYIMGEGL